MTTRIVATAGHVDHGKSTLVRALTGTDPDRLPEEKRRGLTIDLGFARLDLGHGDDIHVIDVPGHVRFVGTMLAGVGAIDACLLVVAATEGWMAQTEEHLRILQLIGVERGVVAVTMSDLAEPTSVDATLASVTSALRGSFLEDAPRVLVDSVTGRGLDDLRRELAGLVHSAQPRPAVPRMRLWIDRSFSLPGAGTIVTGTLTGAPVAVSDTVHVSTRKGLRTARVRGLQSFAAGADQLAPGRRVALNLTGVGHQELHRGDAVIDADKWRLTDVIDASLEVLPSTARPIRSSTGAYVLHLGSDEQAVRIQVLGARSIAPGSRGLVRLRLRRPVPVVPGDRYVLRDAGPWATVGGGEILDIAPVLRPSKARPDRDPRRVVAEWGWVDADELERLTGAQIPPTLGRWVVDPGALEALRETVHRHIDEAGAHGLDAARLDDRERALVQTDDQLEVRAGRVHARATADALDRHPYLGRLAADLFNPTTPVEAGVSEADVRELVRRGLAIREDGIVFSARAIPEAARAAADLLAGAPHGFTVAELRDRLGTSRRFVVPLLARLDRDGVTRRRGDLRIAGPRLPDREG